MELNHDSDTPSLSNSDRIKEPTSNNGTDIVQILEESANGSLTLNEEALKSFFNQPKVKDYPVAIISIAGGPRTGKSIPFYLLKEFLKLKLEMNWECNIPCKNYFGHQKETRGIWMWKNPLFFQRNEQQVTVLLLLCQGNFAEGISDIDREVFAICSFLSSVQIYNQMRYISAQDWSLLNSMKKYAEEGQAKDNSELEYYYFQNLCFLIRDCDDKDHEHGLDGGKQYLDELRQKMKLTGQLDKTFQEMKCFLIPYPGQAIRESYEPGVEGFLPAKNLDGKFKKNLEKLFCFLFEKLVDVKRLRNCPLTGESFLHLCCNLNKLLKSSNLLEPVSTMKVFASEETSITCKKLVDKCKNKMDSLKDKVVSKKELQNILDKLEKDSAKELRDIYNFPYEDVKAEQELFLKRDIQALYPHYESEVSTREIEVRRHFEELLEKCFTVFKEKIEKEIEVAKMEAKESFKKECPEVPFLSDEYEEKLQLKMEKIFEKEKEVEKDEQIVLQTQSHSLQNKLNAEEISTTKKKELDATFIPLDKIDEVSDDKGFLGRGSFGTIRLAFTDGHGAVAIKRFNTTGTRTKIDDENSKMIETVRNYKMAAHENLVRLHGYSKWPDAQIGIVMEYMPGRNLDDFLFAKKKDGNYKISRIPAVIQLRICDDVASGIAFLHYGFSKNLRMTHGDLKPENVLLTTDLRCKVSDLDGAHLATCTEAQTTKKKQENIIHTCLYSAPERLRGSTCRTSKAMDVYSYSLICYIVITRVLPFPETWQREDLVANVANGHYRPSLDKVKCVKKDFRRNDAEIIDLLCQEMVKCWQEQPEKRPTISEVRDIFHRKFAAADQSEVAADVAEITREMDIKIPDRSQYKFKSNTEENMSISKPAISDTKQSRLIYDQDNSLDYC